MSVDPHHLLSKAPLFAGVDEAVLAEITAGARSRDFKRRTGRIDADELCRRLHFVVSGEVHLLQSTPDGQECLIQRFTAGDFFCLTTLLSGRCCNAYAVCASASRLLLWTQEQFRQLLNQDVNLYHNLLEQMAGQIIQERNLRTLNRCTHMDSKLLAFLLHQVNSAHCCLQQKTVVIDLRPINLTAQELGIARETLSRSLQRLAQIDGISYERGQVHLADPRLLEQLLADTDCNCHQE